MNNQHLLKLGTSLKVLNKGEAITGWLMAGPAIVLLFVFLILPFFMAFGLAFTNQRLISPNPTEWVGLRNFQRLLTIRTLVLEPVTNDAGQLLLDEDGNAIYPELRDFTRSDNPQYEKYRGTREWFSYTRGDNRIVILASDVVFLKAVFNTFRFVLVIVPLQGGVALLLALLVNRKLRGVYVFRTIYFMPAVVSMVVLSLLWRFIYDGNNGLLNSFLAFITFGIAQPVDWLGQTNTAMPAIIFMSAWGGCGLHMVLWLAGLQNIPTIRYEAADIDGVNVWQKFRYVTWPGLKNTAVFIFIIITIQAFGLFIQINAMTQGGPLDSTQTVVFQAIERGYGKQDIAGGATISVIFFLMVLTVSLVQRYLTRDK